MTSLDSIDPIEIDFEVPEAANFSKNRNKN